MDTAEKLRQLDCVEGYRPDGNGHYIRIRKEVTIPADNRVVHAWVYLYPEDGIDVNIEIGKWIPNGNWRDFCMWFALQ